MRGSYGSDRMLVGCTITCAISTVHDECCVFESRPWRSVFDTTLCQ